MKSVVRLRCQISVSVLLILFSEIAAAVTAVSVDQVATSVFEWVYALTEIISALLGLAIILASFFLSKS